MGYKLGINTLGMHGQGGPLDALPYRKIALVCEGGGQRGIFTAGILDTFLKQDFFPFQLMIGTSAGAQNVSAYACGQHGYARDVITRLTTSREFFNPMRFIRGGHLIDLDWLLDTTAQSCPLDLEQARRRLEGRELLLCACRSDDFRPVYFRVQQDDWLGAIKASSAVPLFYRRGAVLNGVTYLDGGVRDAIPVREAWQRGADLIVVICTTPAGVMEPPPWRLRMQGALAKSRFRDWVALFESHEQSYVATQKFIENPPGNLRIVEIAPRRPLRSRIVGSSAGELDSDYRRGTLCARHFLNKVAPYLQQVDPR